jgi:hypothetical protein
MKNIFISGFLLILLIITSSANINSKKLNVYMAKGKGAISILDDSDYQGVFQNGIFKDHNLIIDTSSGKQAFLDQFFASNIVYLSLHANPKKWVVGNGEVVTVTDLAQTYQAKKKGPNLVIVTGCETIKDDAETLGFASAIGITDNSNKRAYLGYRTITVGLFSDRFFRVFLATWMKPKADGNYRTLEEARTDTKDFINRMLDRQKDKEGTARLGKLASFAPLDPKIGGSFYIIGNSELRFNDL